MKVTITILFFVSNACRFASKEAEVRALVEGQLMAKRIHADRLGLKIGNVRPTFSQVFPIIFFEKLTGDGWLLPTSDVTFLFPPL